MYVQKIIRGIINLLLIAMAAVCTAFICSCDSPNSVYNIIDNVRPSSHFRVVEFHLHGDTLTYYRVRIPHPLR